MKELSLSLPLSLSLSLSLSLALEKRDRGKRLLTLHSIACFTRNPYDFGSWLKGHGVCSVQMSTESTESSSPYLALNPALSASAEARCPPPVSDMRIITRFCVLPEGEPKRARKGAPRAVGREKASAGSAVES